MSMEARRRLVDHPHTFFQNEASMHADLLDESLTQSMLIALLLELVDKGHILEFTCIRSGHHNDGPNGHNPGGRAADMWPLASATAGDYLDAGDSRFGRFLADLAGSQYRFQVGLVGDGSDSAANFAIAIAAARMSGSYEDGVSVFQDDGGSHVHGGAIGQ